MIAVSRDVVVQFLEEASWTARAKAIERVATRYVEDALTPEEAAEALDLFRAALYDAEPLVRRVLAESLKRAPALPADIVQALAQDVPEVAAPFLAASPLLGEDELIAIAKGGAGAHRAAIACRPSLSERLAHILFGRAALA